MEAVARSYLMAGVALVGAGAIAAGPVQAVPPEVQVPAVASSTAEVELNALVNPIELWADLIGESVTNVGAIADTILANPAPILANIIGNQLVTADVLAQFATGITSGLITGLGDVPAALGAALQEIAQGNINDGLNNMVAAFIMPVVGAVLGSNLGDVITVLQNPFLNAANVIEAGLQGAVIGVGLPALGLVMGPVNVIGETGQAILDGFQAGDMEAVANAVISFPSNLVGDFVNGSAGFGSGGLLGEYGLVQGLLNFRQTVADALQPPALSTLTAVATAPKEAARTVTLAVDAPAVTAEPKVQAKAPVAEPDAVAVVAEAAGKAADAADATPAAKKVVTTDGNKVAPTTLAGDRAGGSGTGTAASQGDDAPKASGTSGKSTKSLSSKKKQAKASAD